MSKAVTSVTVVSPASRFANVLLADDLSRFAYVSSQFPNCFHLISSWTNEVYTDAQRSFFFLSGRTQDVAGFIQKIATIFQGLLKDHIRFSWTT